MPILFPRSRTMRTPLMHFSPPDTPLAKKECTCSSSTLKGKLPKKTCGDGSKPTTTKYGAPTKDKEFEIGAVTRLAFNDRSKSFEFEVEHFFPNDETTHLYWLTWAEMNSFHQYQVALWFFLRNDHEGGDTFEEQVPSSSAVDAVTNAEDTEDDE